MEKTGPVSYKVQVSNQIWRRHCDQLLDQDFTRDGQDGDSVSESRSSQDENMFGDILPFREIQIESRQPESSVEVAVPNASPIPNCLQVQEQSSPEQVTPQHADTPKRYPKRERKSLERLSYKL